MQPDPGALPSWEGRAEAQFYDELIRDIRKRDPDKEKRTATQETLQHRGPHDWEAWTDGSVGGAEDREGGAGGVILRKRQGEGGMINERKEAEISEPAGRCASSYTTEIRAIRHALGKLAELMETEEQEKGRKRSRSERDGQEPGLGKAAEEERTGTKVLIATDSQSAVKALSAGPAGQKGREEQNIWRHIRELFNRDTGRTLTVQWIPSHCGVKWNERADELAKEGTKKEQADEAIGLDAAAAEVRRAGERAWARQRARTFTAQEKIKGAVHWYAALPAPHVKVGREYRERKGGWHTAARVRDIGAGRRAERMIHQFRAGKTAWCEDHGMTKESKKDQKCRRCGKAKDGVRHVLLECTNTQIQQLREETLGPEPTMRVLTSIGWWGGRDSGLAAFVEQLARLTEENPGWSSGRQAQQRKEQREGDPDEQRLTGKPREGSDRIRRERAGDKDDKAVQGNKRDEGDKGAKGDDGDDEGKGNKRDRGEGRGRGRGMEQEGRKTPT
eukprot:gene2450-2892_t